MFKNTWNRDGIAINQNFKTTPSMLHITDNKILLLLAG
jgi:hypothetical protein